MIKELFNACTKVRRLKHGFISLAPIIVPRHFRNVDAKKPWVALQRACEELDELFARFHAKRLEKNLHDVTFTKWRQVNLLKIVLASRKSINHAKSVCFGKDWEGNYITVASRKKCAKLVKVPAMVVLRTIWNH